MVPVSPKLLLDSSFAPIAHCGKEDPFVMKWMHQALTALSSHPNKQLANSATDMGKELKVAP